MQRGIEYRPSMEIRPIKIKHKKSAIEDIFFLMVILVGLALFFLIINMVFGQVNNRIAPVLSSHGNNSIMNVTNMLDQSQGTTTLYNSLFPFIFIGLFGFVLFSAGFIGESPIMIVLGIIVLGVAIILAVVYSNVFQRISETSTFAASNANFPIMNYFMQYLPIIMFVVAIAVIVFILLRKSGGGSGI